MVRAIYECHYRSGAGAIGSALTLPGGQTTLVQEIGFPPKGRIKRLIVVRLTGSLEYTVDLFSSAAAIGQGWEELAKIVPTQRSQAGKVTLICPDDGYAYTNTEGSPALPVRKLYLRIQSLGTPDSNMTFAVALGGEPVQGM